MVSQYLHMRLKGIVGKLQNRKGPESGVRVEKEEGREPGVKGWKSMELCMFQVPNEKT